MCVQSMTWKFLTDFMYWRPSTARAKKLHLSRGFVDFKTTNPLLTGNACKKRQRL
jgi:hypothetical protein